MGRGAGMKPISITDQEIITEYRDNGKFILQICHEHHAGIRRVRRVLDQEGLRGGTLA